MIFDFNDPPKGEYKTIEEVYRIQRNEKLRNKISLAEKEWSQPKKRTVGRKLSEKKKEKKKKKKRVFQKRLKRTSINVEEEIQKICDSCCDIEEMNRKIRNLRSLDYYYRNRNKVRKYNESRKDQIRIYNKRYYQENKEWIDKRNKRYNKEHNESIKRYNKKYYKKKYRTVSE